MYVLIFIFTLKLSFIDEPSFLLSIDCLPDADIK